MKVRTDQVEALRQQQEQSKVKPAKSEGDSFGDLLAQEVGQTESAKLAQETTGVTPPPPGAKAMGIGQVVETQATENAAETGQAELQVMERIETVLDKWQNYAESLSGTRQQGLKQAYGQLETIAEEVQELKQTMPELQGQRPELEGIVDELEILAATETYKFNRGDYL